MGKYDNNENLINRIKETPVEDLQTIADELRDELIKDVSETGGHLASNLGVVELTVALHKVFDTPKDKIIWDVGHQCYIHKMITGRREEMKTLRSLDGISGFPKRSESEHDIYDSGHSGTSISAALGFAVARDLSHDEYSCIAVIGDGALTGGVAYEAMNHAAISKTPLIIILNDNQMSISSSIGGMSTHLNHLRTSRFYMGFKTALQKTKKSAPGLYGFLKGVRDFIKYFFVPKQIFEEIGIKYYGPIDGHDIGELVHSLRFAKEQKKPVLIHVITKKGKGFEPAEQNPSKYHGIGPFSIEEADAKETSPGKTWSEVFGSELLSQATANDKIVAVSAAMTDSTGLDKMQKIFPERVFDVGIAEQHAVSFAAGLALNGCRPVVAIYSTFLQRAYDELLTEVCLQKLPVVFAVDRAGVTGSDGETHQGIFDISYLYSMPNMTILSPHDESSLRGCLDYALKLNCPCAIRYGKGDAIASSLNGEKNYIPGIIRLKEGFEYLIISDGAFADTAYKAASMLKQSIEVLTFEVLKPLDEEFVISLLKKYKAVITIEDGTIEGGFGSEIAKISASDKSFAQVLTLGWPDKFIEHGSIKELRSRYSLDPDSVAQIVEVFIENKA